jgi:hypothetical protein
MDSADRALFGVLIFAALMVMGYGSYAMQATAIQSSNLTAIVDNSYQQEKNTAWHYQNLSSGQKLEDIANDNTYTAVNYPSN